ncbi:MAG: ATP-binding protein [Eubacteriales bacterium]|nr:ATP-binding protein [Eubacteriales bacterium]
MSYTTETYDKAQTILDRRKERATLEAQSRIDEISNKIPELKTIQTKLAQVGLNISKAFLTSKNPQAEIDKLRIESLALQDRKKKILKENGYSEDALSIKYTCPACEDTGFIGGRRCKCYINLLKEIERAKIEKIAPIDECTFESFDTNYYPEEMDGVCPKKKAEIIKENCKRYATSFTKRSKSLLFMGNTGLGKTHLSLAIANVVINRGYSVIYGTAQNILRDLQNENFGRTDNLRYFENEILSTDLLILDDLGTEFKNQFTVSCLYNIINSRLCAKLPTIISTNYTFEELEEKYDQRITSRITGQYSTLILVGNDIRYIK